MELRLDDNEIFLRFHRDGQVTVLYTPQPKKRGKRQDEEPVELFSFNDTYEAERFGLRLLKLTGAAEFGEWADDVTR